MLALKPSRRVPLKGELLNLMGPRGIGKEDNLKIRGEGLV